MRLDFDKTLEVYDNQMLAASLSARKSSQHESFADATSSEKTIVAIGAIAAFAAVVLFVVNVVAIIRARARLPFIFTLVSLVIFLAQQFSMIAYRVYLYDAQPSIWRIVNLNATAIVLRIWSEAFLLAAVFALLRDRWNAVDKLRARGDGGQLAKLVSVIKEPADMALLGLLLLCGIIIGALLGSANTQYLKDEITGTEFQNREDIAAAFDYLAIAILCVVVADITTTVVVLRKRVALVASRDLPANRMAYIIIPVLVVHALHRIFHAIWDAQVKWGTEVYKAWPAVNILNALVPEVVLVSAYTILLIRNFRASTGRETLGYVDSDGAQVIKEFELKESFESKNRHSSATLT